jgi:hypothetical protein
MHRDIVIDKIGPASALTLREITARPPGDAVPDDSAPEQAILVVDEAAALLTASSWMGRVVVCARCGRRYQAARVRLRLAQQLHLVPAGDPGAPRAAHDLAGGPDAYALRRVDLAVATALLPFQSKNLSGFQHGQSLRCRGFGDHNAAVSVITML